MALSENRWWHFLKYIILFFRLFYYFNRIISIYKQQSAIIYFWDDGTIIMLFLIIILYFIVNWCWVPLPSSIFFKILKKKYLHIEFQESRWWHSTSINDIFSFFHKFYHTNGAIIYFLSRWHLMFMYIHSTKKT